MSELSIKFMIIYLILFRTQAKLKLIIESNYMLNLGSFSFFLMLEFFHKLFYCSISIFNSIIEILVYFTYDYLFICAREQY